MSYIGDDTVVLEVDGRRIDRWKQYSINSHFIIPADAFSFEVGGSAITPELIKLLKPGKPVKITINGLVQMAGAIDVVDSKTTRQGGSIITIEGRDKFGAVLDSQIDPRKKWKDTTLDKFVADTLEPFGFTTFFDSNEANTNVQAGKAVKRHNVPKKLKEYRTSYAKPQSNECVWSFVSRITQHLGKWIWPTVDGDGVIVGTPDYDQDSRYRIINRLHGSSENNIIEGGIRRDATGQPSFIVGRGRIPGKTFERTKTAIVMSNPIPSLIGQNAILPTSNDEEGTGAGLGEYGFGYSEGRLKAIKETETVVVAAKAIELGNEFAATFARPIYLQDDHSKTAEELAKFVQREMSLRIRHALVGRYLMRGHSQGGQPWTIDSVVSVTDEGGDWDRPMWILSRTFRKDRSGGTTTELECLPLHSLVF